MMSGKFSALSTQMEQVMLEKKKAIAEKEQAMAMVKSTYDSLVSDYELSTAGLRRLCVFCKGGLWAPWS
jgi:hypothetical protein